MSHRPCNEGTFSGTITAGAAVAGALASATMSAGITLAQSKMAGASWGQSALSAGISFGASMASFGMGSGLGQAATAAGSVVRSVAIGAATSGAAMLTRAAVATSGDLSQADWDQLMLDWAEGVGASAAGSVAGAAVGAGLAGEGESDGGRAGSGGNGTGGGPEIISGGPPAGGESGGSSQSGSPSWDKAHWEGKDVVLIAHTKDNVALVKNWAAGLRKAGANVTTYTGGKNGDFSYDAYSNWAKSHQGEYDTALVFAHGKADQGGQIFFGPSRRGDAVGPNITPERFKEYSASLMYLTKDKGTVGFYSCNLGRGGDNSFLGKFYDYAQQPPGTGRNVHGFSTKYDFDLNGSGVGRPLVPFKATITPRSIFNWNKYIK